MADFGWSLLYWAEPDDPVSLIPDCPTLGEQFPDRAEVARRYARASGLDLSDLDYYFTFGWWKMACIVAGVYERLRQGAGGGMETGPLDQVLVSIDRLLEAAAHSGANL